MSKRTVSHEQAQDDEEEFPLGADAVEKIRRGLAEVDAGQTVSLEEACADLKAAFVAL